MKNEQPVEKITVIGIGRLGLCLALALEKAGYHVLGVDVSPEYIAEINAKTLISPEPGVSEYLKKSKNLKATASLQEGINFSDIYLIAVPTNTVPEIQSYDHSILSGILTSINALRVANKHIVIASTVFPGYISNTALKLIKDCQSTTISYNPELIAQGEIIKGLTKPDVILIGEGSPAAGRRLEAINKKICTNSPYIARMSVASAEIAKLAINCFITTKIAFANQLADIADETPNADKEAIYQAIGHDQRIGMRNLLPGYGYGGPCFPRDNRALGNYASLIGLDPLFFRTTDKTNALHAKYMSRKLLEKNQDRYVFEDVSYKSCPVPIIECSQKLAVAKLLAEFGKVVTIRDREEVIRKVQQEYKDLFKYEIIH